MAELDPGPPQRTTGERLRAAARKLRLMPHEERRALIERPFPAAKVHAHSSAWGGVFIRESVPTEGRRVWQERPEDEEWMKNRWEEK